MKKQLSLLMILCIIVIVAPYSSKAIERIQDLRKPVSKELLEEVLKATEGIQDLQKPASKELLEEALIERLSEPIGKVVGRAWNTGNEKILEIKKSEKNSTFYVTVQVISFEGPHNPPYTEETIMFKIKGNKVKPIDYFNRDIPENEWDKLQL